MGEHRDMPASVYRNVATILLFDLFLRFKCTKFNFGWSSAPDSAGTVFIHLILTGEDGEGELLQERVMKKGSDRENEREHNAGERGGYGAIGFCPT